MNAQVFLQDLLKRSGPLVLMSGWHLIRVPTLVVLTLLEPIVSFVFVGLALLGILMALFYRFIVELPDFPFWLMMGLSIGLALCPIPYYAVMRLLSR